MYATHAPGHWAGAGERVVRRGDDRKAQWLGFEFDEIERRMRAALELERLAQRIELERVKRHAWIELLATHAVVGDSLHRPLKTASLFFQVLTFLSGVSLFSHVFRTC
jgi:hypothetical protein